MYIHINDLHPILQNLIKSDVIDKFQLTADTKNPARVFAISCFSNAYLGNLLSKLPNVQGYINMPSREQALTALKDAGGVLPFFIAIPMGLDFSIKLNKSDLEKLYSALEDKFLDELPTNSSESEHN